MAFKEGDYVKITARDITPGDTKSGTYYPFFRDLAGTVDRIYGEEVCIKVDHDTLPEDVLKRHLDIQESIRRKWLNGLSGEARNRLTPEEKQFDLAYTILVQSSDLEKAKPGQPRPAKIKSVQPLNPPVDEVAADDVTAEAEPVQVEEMESKSAKKSASKAVTPKDLEAAEIAFLKEREKALKDE